MLGNRCLTRPVEGPSSDVSQVTQRCCTHGWLRVRAADTTNFISKVNSCCRSAAHNFSEDHQLTHWVQMIHGDEQCKMTFGVGVSTAKTALEAAKRWMGHLVIPNLAVLSSGT